MKFFRPPHPAVNRRSSAPMENRNLRKFEGSRRAPWTVKLRETCPRSEHWQLLPDTKYLHIYGGPPIYL